MNDSETKKTTITRMHYKGERPLFASHGLKIYDTVFDEGESPLKESSDIELYGSMFKWKYPLWYCKNVYATDTTWFTMARAGVWYTDNVTVENCAIEAPKNFRRCDTVTLRGVSFPDASETLWSCRNVTLEDVTAKGTYFAMNSENMLVTKLTLYGDYSFDGTKNVTVEDSRLLSKDAFWNSENVTVKDTFISGEYLGWNAKNLTLENCTIESLQGLCYIGGLTMKNCKLINTTLAFEYSTDIDADIVGSVDSVINPTSGTIRADHIDELIIEPERVDPSRTKIIYRA